MFDLNRYGLYLDAREGVPLSKLAHDYGLPVEEVQERLAAARLCFEKQVDHIEFVAEQRRDPDAG